MVRLTLLIVQELNLKKQSTTSYCTTIYQLLFYFVKEAQIGHEKILNENFVVLIHTKKELTTI